MLQKNLSVAMGVMVLLIGLSPARAQSKAARSRGIAQSAGDDSNDAEKRGFTTPGTGFGNNPFSPKPAAPSAANNNDADDDDDSDDTDAAAPDDAGLDQLSEEILRSRMENRMKERGGVARGGVGAGAAAAGSAPGRAAAPAHDFRQAGSDIGATSLTGGANAQIESSSKAGCLKLDPNTGYGPDIVSNFDFPDADIIEIAKTLGRLTCQNFIYDKDVKGKISIVSNAPITIGEAWKAFLTALEVNNFSIVPSGAYLRITRKRDAREKQIVTYAGSYSPDTDTLITRVLRLKYIGAEEAARVFRNFMSPDTRIVNYDQTNTLIITDTGANVKKLSDIIKLLDVEGYDESLEVIRIKNASAQEIAKLIDQLLPGSQGSAGGPGAPIGIPRFRTGGGFTARKTKEGGEISHIIPDDRTNSVIVSANKRGLEQVRELIDKLDSKVTASAGSSRIHVVYLQFADAEQVAQTLSNLASGSAAKPAGQPGAAPTTAQLFEDAIKVAADKPTNSLVITGSPTDFQTISRVIAKLDVPRDQVYVETVIMEIDLSKNFQLGTAVALPNSGMSFIPDQNFGSAFGNLLTNPLANTGLVMGFQAGNGSKTFSVGGNTVTVKSLQGLITALQGNSVGNILATPQILTLDNQEAEIEIGETVPVPTVTAIQGSTSTSFSREKVALNLKIKPQINKISDFVKLDIKQKYADFAPTQRVTNSPVPGTIERSSSTTVVVQDSDTVALGGLISDKTTESTTKVPLLGDIPLLGWLFRSKTTSSSKSNLIVFITPHVVKQYSAVRKILDKKLQQRDEFLEKNAGGEDPLLDAKLNLIKELPPVESLKGNTKVTNSEIQTANDALRESEEPQPTPEPSSDELAPPSSGIKKKNVTVKIKKGKP